MSCKTFYSAVEVGYSFLIHGGVFYQMTAASQYRLAHGRIVVFLFAAFLVVAGAHGQSTNFPGQLGSIPHATGVTFRVWAPNATSVGVKGQFNGWATTPMVNEGGGTGYWSVYVANAQVGQQYKYRINNSFDKRDPRARRVTASNGNSIIYDPSAFDWGLAPIPQPWRNDLVIYQMHVGTFGGQNPPSSFDQAIDRLDHVRNLGVNVIKLMPVNEFPGGRSWGYNPADLFAVESDYGGPNALKRFMRAAHERGISVFMDVVHNHYGPTDLDLWRFDGWSQNGLGGIYFYNDGRAHTPWGSTRPDFGRSQVRDFIRDQIMMWVEEYRIGGFRWDSVYNIINTDLGYNDTGRAMLNTINTELANNYDYVVRGAEDNAFDGTMNFENQWDVGYFWDLRWQVMTGSDAERNMNTVAGLLSGWASHQRVVFSEAHDYIAANHGRTRIPSVIDSGDNESIWARKRSLLAAGIVMTTPGIPMIFQGQEMLETQAFHDDTPLRWNRADTFADIVQAYTDLIHSRRNLRGGMQGLKGTGIHTHYVNNSDKVIAYVRWDQGGQTDDVVVVANFSSVARTNNNYMIPFPSDGVWHSHFNSDAQVYGSDFGGIGAAQITASGGQAAVNMGAYSIQIFSQVPPQGTGVVSFDPPAPSGCVDVTITFDPAGGPLADATNVVIFLGRNGWQDAEDVPMFDQGDDTWAATVTVAEATYELNMVFNDGATEDPVWDTNEGRDWLLSISNCAGLPALVTTDPAYPSGCAPITLHYKQREGALSNATAVLVHLGHNGWLNIQQLAMTNTVGDEWSATYQIPEGTWQLDFVLNDGEGTWDNNNGNDWQVYVTGCVAEDFTGVAITNPVSDLTVPYTQTTFTVRGDASRLEGHLQWENQKTGDGDMIPASTNWMVMTLPLDVGANLFRISGTNITENPNAGAVDSATNALYTSGGWLNGQNGGHNWGDGWHLLSTADSGHFLASGETNQALLPHAWALWAEWGGLSEGIRPFNDHLHVGDVFSVRFENNWIQDGGTVGISLQNRFGQSLFEFLFIGQTENYLINDAELARDTGIPYTDGGLDLTFELTSATDYRFTANAVEITGTLASTSEALVRQFRAFNSNAGGGSDHNVYFTDLAIDGQPLESVEHSATRTINRRYGPHFEALTTEEEDELHIRFPVTESGLLYDVHYTTNLITGPWTPFGFNLQGFGPPLNIYLTNAVPQLYFRSSVQPLN